MQNVMNRLCPLIQPVLTNRSGRTRAMLHENVRLRRIVLVSPSGWWEIENFSTVTRIVNELAEGMGIDFAGAVLRPHVYVMKRMPEKERQILSAVRDSGRQLADEGKISQGTLDIIAQPLIPFDECISELNEMYVAAKASAVKSS